MGESPQLPNTRYGVAIAARGAAPPRETRQRSTPTREEAERDRQIRDKEKFVDLNDYDCPKQDCLSRSEC